MAESVPLDKKFSPFTTYTTPYKTVNDQPIPLWVMIPKNCPSGPRPILVFFHGGGLTTGHALFGGWSSRWSLDYAIQQNAIMVRANHRLLPESTGLDVLSDISDFWTWMENDLGKYLESVHAAQTPDLGKVLAYGESAGGYLAIQSGLMRRDLVKAVIASYPMTLLEEDAYTKPGIKPFLGHPQLDPKVFDDHLANMVPGKIVTGVYPYARMDITLVVLQQGLFPQIMGLDESLYPSKVLAKIGREDGKKGGPLLFLLHGEKDSGPPVEHSKRFVKQWKSVFGETRAREWYPEGKDHGFDVDLTLEDEGIKGGIEGITGAWLNGN